MRTFMLLVALLVTGFVLTQIGEASRFDKKTILTFSQPVQVPGAILEPGTYVIRRTNPGGNPDIVSFLNRDETHVYATVYAIPTERPKAADETQIVFAETPSGEPEAIKKWYYPGDLTGEEFVYPKGQLLAMAGSPELQPRESVSDAGPAAPAPIREAPPAEEMATEEMAAEPSTEMRAEQPAEAQEPVETAQVREPAPPPEATTRPERAADPSAVPMETLPDTASSLPLLALIGVAGLSLGGAVRRFARAKK